MSTLVLGRRKHRLSFSSVICSYCNLPSGRTMGYSCTPGGCYWHSW